MGTRETTWALLIRQSPGMGPPRGRAPSTVALKNRPRAAGFRVNESSNSRANNRDGRGGSGPRRGRKQWHAFGIFRERRLCAVQIAIILCLARSRGKFIGRNRRRRSRTSTTNSLATGGLAPERIIARAILRIAQARQMRECKNFRTVCERLNAAMRERPGGNAGHGQGLHLWSCS